MESQSDYSTPPNSGTTSPYHVFAFTIPTTPQLPRSADTSGPDLELGSRLNETSTSGTPSTPYSSLIATPNSVTGHSTPHPLHERQAPVSLASQRSTLALRTASSRPPFAFFPHPEPNHHDLTDPPTPSPQSSPPKAEELVPDDEDQDEKSIRVPPLPGSPFSQSPDTISDDDSPYPEVRASVANTDDPDMPALTFRTWLIGITLLISRACLNVFFYLRWPSPGITRTFVIIIIAYPFGKALDHLLPIRHWSIPRALPIIGGFRFSLNPGPFNIKEHTLILIMSSIGSYPVYGLGLIMSAEKDYSTPISTGFAFLFLLGSQVATFSFAALGRSLFVYPASVIWPNTLIVSALLNTLHAEEETRKGQMTRYRFFVVCGVGAFFYHFLPGYLFTALSSFSWACWISPNNVVLNQLFGTVTGLGMGLLTFDWSQISYIASPLILPWWASVNVFLGFVAFCWILAPILYYNNVWKVGHFPITGYSAYDRFGLPYDVHRILTPDLQLNVTAYQEYSAVYLPVTFALTYFIGFILATSVIVHAILYESHAVLAVVRRRKAEDDDIHASLMRRYREVSNYYYMGVFVAGFACLIGAFKVQDLGVPIWSLFLATLLAFIYFIPCTYIYARSGCLVPINLIAELIPGALLPGRPFANMVFKICAVNGLNQSMLFLENLKQGHYLKIPPYANFAAQLVAAVISVCVQIVVKNAIFASVPDICDPNQPQKLVCAGANTFFTASIIWGLIGTRRQLFGKGSLYQFHVYGLVIGALLPIPLWLWQRKYPKSALRHFNLIVFLNSPTYAPPATGVNFTSFFTVAFLFQYLLRVRRYRLWAKFNHVLAGALEAGTGVAVTVVFLAFQLPKGGRISPDWWGNTVWANTADAIGAPYFPTDPDKGFSVPNLDRSHGFIYR